MKVIPIAVAALAFCATALPAQPVQDQGIGEVLVTGNRQNIPYANTGPVVGLRRKADGAVLGFTITSDTREEPARKAELHAVVLSVLDRAAAAGLEVVSGNVQLQRVTRANYKDLFIGYAGRADTGKIDLLLKGKLGQTAAETKTALKSFIAAQKGSGRAVITSNNDITLTISNPDQYRDEIVRLVAVDAQHMASLFGPNFTFNVTGIDGQVIWTQVSATDVFLFIPYKYVIFPK